MSAGDLLAGLSGSRTATLSQEEMRRLLAAAQRGDAAARERLVEANLRLAAQVVTRYPFQGADREDLFQVACMGLIKAIDRFDLSFNVAFSTYAVPVMIGEIRQHLRKSRPLKVARGLVDLAHSCQKAAEELTQSLGRSPTPNEIAQAVGAAPEDVVAAMDAVTPPQSLDDVIYEGDGQKIRLEESIGTSDGESHIEQLALRQVFSQLGQADREFLVLRYFRGKSQMEVARLLGLSQASISRWERRLLGEVRELLA